MNEDNKLKLHSLSDFQQFQEFISNSDSSKIRKEELSQILDQSEFSVAGRCHVCNSPVEFQVDYLSATGLMEEGKKIPNWRECLVCPRCNLNNRMRAVIHLMESLGKTSQLDNIYITEQLTYLYQVLLSRYPNLIGSEFLGEHLNAGELNENGIRHEDMTALSFEDESFTSILTFDVLEHIPDYQQALRESARCLKKDGTLFLTAPFVITSNSTKVRASVGKDGQVTHHLPEEYHGDPTNPEAGILCYYHFGWDLLDQLIEAGFHRSCVNLYWSRKYGYFGGYQVIITAAK